MFMDIGTFHTIADFFALFSIFFSNQPVTNRRKRMHIDTKKVDRCDIIFFSFALLTVSILYLLVYSDLPIYGDAWGYGYKCANWISNNGLQLIPTGTGRGETAGGHASFYFWMWAAVMKVFGHTIKAAHLLPAAFAFLAVAGTYKLGRDLAGKAMGIASGIALLVSPLFLAQAFRPLPIAAVMAASVWSLFFYKREKYFIATLFCVFAVMMREQALMLSITYIAVEFYFSKEKNWLRILLFATPFLVPVVNGIFNYFLNGFVFLKINMPGIDQEFSPALFLQRLKFFGSYFYIDNFRWLPIGISSGILLSRFVNRKAGIALGLVLCTIGASGRLQNYFLVILFASLLYPVLFKKASVNRMALVLGLFPLLMVLFFTTIVFATSTSMTYMFFRYLAAAFPALILGTLWTLFKTSRKSLLIAVVFIAATAAMNFTVRFQKFYSETTLTGYSQPLRVIREAGAWAEKQGLTVISTGAAVEHFSNPELGYSNSILSVITIDSVVLEPRDYAIVIPPVLPWGDDGETTLSRFTERIGTDYRLELNKVITRGSFVASCYILRWNPYSGE